MGLFADKFAAFDKSLEDVKLADVAKNKAQDSYSQAVEKYEGAVAAAEKLRAEIDVLLGGVLPTTAQSRVRVSN